MKITALKSGRFAHPEPAQPQIWLKKGETGDYDGKMAASLIDCGWGEPVTDKPEGKSLNKMNKGELIAYAREYAIDLNNSMTKAEMLTALGG